VAVSPLGRLASWARLATVVVVNPRRIRLVAESSLKTDRIDAEILARLGRQEDSQLRPVYQRSEGAQELRTRLRVRTSLVPMGASRLAGFRRSTKALRSIHGPRASRDRVLGWVDKCSAFQRLRRMRCPRRAEQPH